MKKRYIVSWYGVADFRASVEFGDTEGPVLAALKAGDYTDAIILGFTNQDKLGGVASGAGLDYSALCKPNPKDTDEIVERLLNTREAHEHFKNWLSVKLCSAGIATEIHFRPVALRHLNDTENIYKAAMESLSEVEKVQDEKSVAIYLSPGTPVMAFVWAFAALRYPNLNQHLITSSQPGLPPEKVNLPIEWMEWRASQVENMGVSRKEYDVIFHLFGEQRMPSLLGVRQFVCKKHIFVDSRKFPSGIMKKFVKEDEYESMPVPPYELKEIYSSIVSRMERILKSMSNARIGFNLTGGTKLMFAGAFAACRKLGATPFYFDNVNHRVIYMNGFDSDPTRQVESVETFIKLNGDDLVIANKRACGEYPNRISKDRIALTNELFDKRREISQIYNRLSGVNDSTDAFKIENERHGITAKLSSDHLAELSICGKQFKFSNFPWFARYLSGGWLEEYVFMMLKQIKDNHIPSIRDMRINLKVSLKKQNKYGSNPKYQEFDITFTDGRCLFIVECKAGNVKGEDISKFSDITRKFGGIDGVGIVASCFKPSDSVMKKIEDRRNVHLVFGEHLECHHLTERLSKLLSPGGS